MFIVIYLLISLYGIMNNIRISIAPGTRLCNKELTLGEVDHVREHLNWAF